MTAQHARRIAAVALLIYPILVSCRGDVPTGLQAPVLAAMGEGVEGEHEEPDPRVPPVCHGYTATIWWNMPAEWIPKGALIRATVPGHDGGDHDHELASEEEEAPGYFITGTNGPDVIVGSPKRDSISAANGDDVICADPPQHEEEPDHEEGEECEGGGSGGSPGHGGGGPDWTWGGNGLDRIYGGGGPDSIYAGLGDDVVFGGGGPDYVLGETGDDELHGGPGPDLIYGGSGNDTMFGDVSSDILRGELGDDSLYGGLGLDALDGGKGINLLDPGTQDDDHGDGGCGGGHDPGAGD